MPVPHFEQLYIILGEELVIFLTVKTILDGHVRMEVINVYKERQLVNDVVRRLDHVDSTLL